MGAGVVTNDANVAQAVEQPRRNGQVVGSTPTGGSGESKLRAQLDAVKGQRRETPKGTDEYAALCVEMGRITAEMRRVGQENRRQMVKSHVHDAIMSLSEITAEDLDNCTVQELAQLQYWLSKHQGSIFVKTIGRMAAIVEENDKRGANAN